jgi:hypothetical protein
MGPVKYGYMLNTPESRRSDGRFQLLPKGVFFPDAPEFRKTKCKVGEVSVDDGIHVHAVMVVPKETRLREPLDLHFERKTSSMLEARVIEFTLSQLLHEPGLSPTTVVKLSREDAFRLITF